MPICFDEKYIIISENNEPASLRLAAQQQEHFVNIQGCTRSEEETSSLRSAVIYGSEENSPSSSSLPPFFSAVFPNGFGHAINQLDAAGYAPIHYASAYGDLDICKHLLLLGSQTDLMDSKGDTPLLIACKCGNVEVVQELLCRGASTRVRSSIGETALQAALSGRAASEDEGGNNNTSNNLARLVRLLLLAGVNPNEANESGETAVHHAVTKGQRKSKELLYELLSFGGIVDAQDLWGDKPIHWAVREGNAVAVSQLVRGGASINSQNEDGETPLHLASALGDLQMVSFLLRLGASPNVLDQFGTSPLAEAVSNGHLDIASLISSRVSSSSPGLVVL